MIETIMRDNTIFLSLLSISKIEINSMNYQLGSKIKKIYIQRRIAIVKTDHKNNSVQIFRNQKKPSSL